MEFDNFSDLTEPPRIPPGLWACFIIVAIIGTLNAVDHVVTFIGYVVVVLGATALLIALIAWLAERMGGGPR